jgi:hypothetical protein
VAAVLTTTWKFSGVETDHLGSSLAMLWQRKALPRNVMANKIVFILLILLILLIRTIQSQLNNIFKLHKLLFPSWPLYFSLAHTHSPWLFSPLSLCIRDQSPRLCTMQKHQHESRWNARPAGDTHTWDGHVSEVHLAENVLSVGVCVPVSKAMFGRERSAKYAKLMFWRFWE